MDIRELREIINSDLPNEVIESDIIKSLSKDKEVIPIVMRILERERENNKNLINDMNLELSRAHIYIDERPESIVEGKDRFNKNFVLDEIAKFYIKHKSFVTHCFNRFN